MNRTHADRLGAPLDARKLALGEAQIKLLASRF
jgi:hypothetical protein